MASCTIFGVVAKRTSEVVHVPSCANATTMFTVNARHKQSNSVTFASSARATGGIQSVTLEQIPGTHVRCCDARETRSLFWEWQHSCGCETTKHPHDNDSMFTIHSLAMGIEARTTIRSCWLIPTSINYVVFMRSYHS
jgi:hypothetical protein